MMEANEQIKFIIENFDFERVLELVKKNNPETSKHLTISDLKNEAVRCLKDSAVIKDISEGAYNLKAECYVDDNGNCFFELRYTPVLANSLSKILNPKHNVNRR